MDNKGKLINIQNMLPVFCVQFFDEKTTIRNINTQLSYAYDFIHFFTFVNKKGIASCTIKEMPLTVLDQITVSDINEYCNYVVEMSSNKIANRIDGLTGLKKKLFVLRSLYGFFYSKRLIKTNPVAQVSIPKIVDKTVKIITDDNKQNLINSECTSTNISKLQEFYLEKTILRDFTIIHLILETGIKIEQVYNLNINDVDFNNNCLSIIRKGNYIDQIFYSNKFTEIIKEYIKFRMKQVDIENSDALFLSRQEKRMGIRSIQKLIKKYGKLNLSDNKITAQVLRNSYGNDLYQTSNDLELVANTLGYNDFDMVKRYRSIYN